MRLFLGFVLVMFAACGEIPPPDDLLDAQRDYIDSHIDGESTAGSCEQETDREVMYGNNHYFAERWNFHSGLAGLNETAMRLEFPTLSSSCLQCVGRFTKCSIGQCGIGMCDSLFGYGPKSIQCRECSHNACGAEMIRCSGLLPSEWPDFDRGQS